MFYGDRLKCGRSGAERETQTDRQSDRQTDRQVKKRTDH